MLQAGLVSRKPPGGVWKKLVGGFASLGLLDTTGKGTVEWREITLKAQ